MLDRKVLVYWVSSNEFDIIELDDSEKTPLVHCHGQFPSLDPADCDSSGKRLLFNAHVWEVSASEKALKLREVDLAAAIDAFPWNPKISEKYAGDHCAACLSRSLNPGDTLEAEEDISDEELTVGPTLKKVVKRKVLKNAATVICEVENSLSSASPEKTQDLKVGNDLLSDREMESVRKMLAVFGETGAVPVAEKPDVSELILQKLTALENNVNDNFRSLQVSVSRNEAKLTKLSAQVSKIEQSLACVENRDLSVETLKSVTEAEAFHSKPLATPQSLPYEFKNDENTGYFQSLSIHIGQSPRTSAEAESRADNSGIITDALLSVNNYDPLSEVGNLQLLEAGQTISTPGVGYLQSTPQARGYDNLTINSVTPISVEETVAPQRASVPAKRPLALKGGSPIQPKLGRSVTWQDMGYTVDFAVTALSGKVNWNDKDLILMASQRNSSLYLFGSHISKPQMTRAAFIRKALRHIYSPCYFVNRSVTGRVSGGCAPKRKIDPITFQALLALSAQFCAEDTSSLEKVKEGVANWLRNREFVRKLASYGLIQ